MKDVSHAKRDAARDAIIHPIVICGGSGTRLWPVSRKSYPKQFARILGDHSLFQDCALRFRAGGFAAPTVVTGRDFRFVVGEQLAAIDVAPRAILIEPEGRNTAPAILAAALHVADEEPEAVLLAAPSDHAIPGDAAFRDAIRAALPAALDGRIVTFGIRPDRPETGYGWLEPDGAGASGEGGLRPLGRFVEKPDADTAARMLAEGRCLWNAGLFLFTARSLVAAFETHAPKILAAVRAAVEGAEGDLDFTRLAAAPWAGLAEISIDYAVMEKAANLSVMPYEGRWSDLGDWDAIWREEDRDGDGVALQGAATAIDCEGTLLRSDAGAQQIVGIGLKDLVAVAMPDAVLVADRTRAQEVGRAVAILREKAVPQAETLPRDFRPWGWYESLIVGRRFQVKRIVVHPGAALSLQSHHHRSEHWVVVEGTAKVTVDDTVTLVTENESIYVPLGALHRMENPGKVDLVVIEVQTGAYLGEDDIIRHDDVYARGSGARG